MHPIANIAVDTALVLTTSAWAQWLARHKDFEPDFTWAQVVAGTTLCLAVAELHSRQAGGDWREHRWRVLRAFALGGTPIVVGEVAQWLERRSIRRRYRAALQ